jgi:hypothetical protein
MLTRRSIKRAAAGIFVAVIVAAIGLFVYQVTRARLADTVLTKIDRLVLQPPEGTPELEWAVDVYWTHNLHCEAIPQINESVSALRELNRFLDDAIIVGPDRQTINTLWDRYATMSQSGYRYRTKHEPVREQIVDAVEREGKDYYDAGSYLSFLRSVRSRTVN